MFANLSEPLVQDSKAPRRGQGPTLNVPGSGPPSLPPPGCRQLCSSSWPPALGQAGQGGVGGAGGGQGPEEEDRSQQEQGAPEQSSECH